MSKTRNKRNRNNNYTRKQYQSNDGMLTSVLGSRCMAFSTYNKF